MRIIIEMRILARHKNWVSGAKITESIARKNPRYRRFTATICGFSGWKIYQGLLAFNTAEKVVDKVRDIRNSIESGDESVFYHKGYWIKEGE